MKKNIQLISTIVLGFLLPGIALAINFTNPGCDAKDGCLLIDLGSRNTFPGLLLFLVNLALGVVGILSVAFIIYGGFQYVASRGDEEQAETGRKTLTNAIIGLVIVILSYAMVTVVMHALEGNV